MGLMKKMASVVVTGSLLFGLVGTAMAAPAADPIATAAAKLQTLGIVNGMPNGDLALDQTITRAQLTKILVWAFGKKEDAALLAGANAFPDTAKNWASGEIAIAKAIAAKNNIDLGRPGGVFAPDASVTNAEVVAFMAKFIGVQPDNTQAWPDNYLSAAVKAGLITSADVATIKPIANVAATRGEVFFLADEAFQANIGNGKSVYTTYVKTSAPSLTVDSVDASTTASSITVTGTVSSDATTVYVGSTSNVAAVNNGKFTATVSLALGTNNLTVGAVDLAGNVTTKPLTVTRTVGAAASIAAPASVTATAGQTVDFAAAVKDADGNSITGADVTVNSTLGSYAAGKFTAGTKAGTETATVTYGTFSVPVTVTVNAGALANLVVTPATIDLNAGASQKFTAAGADQYGNAVPAGAITWTASKGIIGNDGSFGATNDATGTVTVTATSGAATGTATANVFGAAAKVQVAAPSALVADGASHTTLTATVLDANGNVAKGYNGTVSFTATGSAVSLSSTTATAVNGVASVTLTAGTTAGSTVLSASAEGLAASAVTYKTTAQTLTGITLKANPGSLNATVNSRGSLEFVMVDQNGNEMVNAPSTTYTVRVASSNTDIATIEGLSSKTYNLSGVDTTLAAKIYGTAKIGSTTISATVVSPTGSSIQIAPVTVSSLLVGEADHITVDSINAAGAGDTSTVTFRVVDFNGNQLTTSAGNLLSSGYTVTVKDASGNTVSPTVTPAAASYGVGTFTINWASLNIATGNAGTYTVSVGTSALASGAQDVTVSPSAAAKLSLSATPGMLAANGSSTGALAVKVLDAHNNVVKDGSYAVVITRTGDAVTSAAATTTVNTVNGVASLALTSGTKVGTDSFVASIADASLTSSSAVTVSTRIIGSANKVALIDGAGVSSDNVAFAGYTATAGSSFNVKVAVEDFAGLTLTNDFNTPVSVQVLAADGTVLGSGSATVVNGVATIPVTVTKAGSAFEVKATSGSLTAADVDAALSVAAAAPASLTVSSDVSTLAADSTADGNTANLTVTLKDEFGNTATNSTGAALTVYALESTTTYGSVTGSAARINDATKAYNGYVPVSIADGASTGTATFTPSNKAGQVEITFAGADLTSGTVDVATAIVGEADALSVSTPASATVSDGSTTTNLQQFTVSLVDGAGNIRTQDSASAVTLAADNGDFADGHVSLFVKVNGVWAPYHDGSVVGVAANNIVSKGTITFGVASQDATSIAYTVASGTFSADATGTFVAGAADHVAVVTSDPASIVGDGIAATGVTAEVVDSFGNVVTTASGTMTFAITTGADYGTLQNLTAPIVNGVATVIARSNKVTSAGDVYVKAGTDLNADGTIDYTTPFHAFSVTAPAAQ